MLNGDELVSIAAACTGYSSAQSALTVQDNESATLSFTLPSSVSEGAGLTPEGRVTASKAPAKDIRVTLTSSNPAQLGVPVSTTILAGTTQATFPLIVTDDEKLEPLQSVTLSASVPNWPTASMPVQVIDDETFTLHLSVPQTLDRYAGVVVNGGSVSLEGTLAYDLTVTLASNVSSMLQVPAQVIIPAGTKQAAFNLTVAESGNPPGSTYAVISASSASFLAASSYVNVTEAVSRVWAINQPSNDLVYDLVRGKLLAAVPASAALVNGGMARILPATGVVENLTPLTKEAGMLRLRSDGTVLWAATRNAQQLFEIDLNSFAVGSTIDLGSYRRRQLFGHGFRDQALQHHAGRGAEVERHATASRGG